MPSKSKAQHNLMAMVAHDPAAAKRLGISQKVGKEFTQADKGRKFAKGGDTMATKDMKSMKGMPTALAKHAAKPASKAHAGLKAGGSVFRKAADGIAKKGKTKGTEIVMKAKGGMCK